MVIKSYLVYPQDKKRDELQAILSNMPECDVTPALNRDLLILVTETEDESAEEALLAKIETISALQSIVLVSGYNAEAPSPTKM